jgi:cell division protease FtsH
VNNSNTFQRQVCDRGALRDRASPLRVATTHQISKLPYSEFRSLLHQGEDRFAGRFRPIYSRHAKGAPAGRTTAVLDDEFDQEFAQELDKFGVRYTGQIESTL